MEMKIWNILFVFWIREFENIYKWKESNEIFTMNTLPWTYYINTYIYNTEIYGSIYKCYFMKSDFNKSLYVEHNILYIKYIFILTLILKSESNFYCIFIIFILFTYFFPNLFKI